MKNRAADESVAEFVSQPFQVLRVGATRPAAGFDFETEYSAVRVLDDDVDFVHTLLGSQVIQSWFGVRHGCFGTQLRDHKRIDQASE